MNSTLLDISCVIIGILIIVLLFKLFIDLFKNNSNLENLYQGPSFNSVSSGYATPYYDRPIKYSDSYNIRKWRTAIPTGPGARTVTDNYWARTYQPGLGFQLG